LRDHLRPTVAKTLRRERAATTVWGWTAQFGVRDSSWCRPGNGISDRLRLRARARDGLVRLLRIRHGGRNLQRSLETELGLFLRDASLTVIVDELRPHFQLSRQAALRLTEILQQADQAFWAMQAFAPPKGMALSLSNDDVAIAIAISLGEDAHAVAVGPSGRAEAIARK
jgi:hypothetical protein